MNGADRSSWIKLLRDVRYSLRALRGSPGFTIITTAVLALAIGSNLLVFLMIDGLLLRSLPVGNPEELIRIASVDKRGLLTGLPSTVLEPLRKEPIFAGVCGFYMPELTTDAGGVVQSSGILSMTGGCFETLRVSVQIGRPFTRADDQYGSGKVAVLTDSFWRSAFGQRAGVIGEKVRVENEIFTIIGVAQQRFTGLLPGFAPALILPLEQTPLHFAPAARHPPYVWVNIIARRARNESEQSVQARTSVIQRQLLEQSVPARYTEAQRQDYFSRRITTSSARAGIGGSLRDRFGKPLYAVLGVCALILCIAGLNTANLMLARGLRRQKEFAIRIALGASKAQLVGLIMLESLLIVSSGTVLGFLFAEWTGWYLLGKASMAFAHFSLNTSAFDSSTLLFLAGLVLFAALVFATPPTWQALRSSYSTKQGGRGIVQGAARGQKVVLGLQVAFTLALVASSSLFSSSLKRLYELNLGIQTRGVSFAMLSAVPGGYASFSSNAGASSPYYEQLLKRVQGIPDVTTASLADFVPFWTRTFQESVSVIENGGRSSEIRAVTLCVTDRFLDTLGARIIAGEGFREGREASGEPTAILSKSLAKVFDDPRLVGEHIRIGNDPSYQRIKVIGIASDLQLSLEDPHNRTPSVIYVNFWQHPDRQRYPVLLVKTASGVPLAPAALARVVESLGHEYVEEYRTVDEQRRAALIEERMLAYLSTAFGVLAITIAAAGLFGLLNYQVIGRTSEIGIRMALGARRAQIRWLIFRELLPILFLGTLGGLGLAMLSGDAIRGLLYGVDAYNVGLLSISAVILFATAAFAAWIPTNRACSVDPLIALRLE